MQAKLIGVYCSSSDKIDGKYYQEAERFGRQLVEHGWGLVYGGGNRGVMGVLGRTVRAAGGHVVGIIPAFMKTRELALDSANELVAVATMRERKQLMEERADGFVTGGYLDGNVIRTAMQYADMRSGGRGAEVPPAAAGVERSV